MGAIRTKTIIRMQSSPYCRTCGELLRNCFQGGYCSPECRVQGQVRRAGPDDCWLWPGPFDQDGYGRFTQTGRRVHAHRLAWTVANKREIPAGLCVCHTCDNPPCCNPAHLFLGTNLENVQDRVRKGRNNPARGENAGPAKLTEDAVRQIRQLKGVESVRALASRFGVKNQCIYKIWWGVRWAHVT